jgi:hypothetical protein
MRILTALPSINTTSLQPLVWATAILILVVAFVLLVVSIAGLGGGRCGRHARWQQRQLVGLVRDVLVCLATKLTESGPRDGDEL